MVMKDASVLVTGATGGVGSALTRALAGLGYTVYAGVRDSAPDLERIAGVRTVRLDVTDPEQAEAAAEEIARESGALRAVVNNAGIIIQGPLELVPPADLRRQFEVNVYGPALVTTAMLPLLRAGHGRVVNVSAPTARLPVPFMGPIGASKAALESLSEAQRGELAAWGIPVVVVVPGGMDTPIFAKAEKSATEAMAQAPADRVRLYAPALEAVQRAGASMTLAPVDHTVQAIVTAIRAGRPKRRYVAGRDARMFSAVSHLPTGTRARMVARTLGLRGLKAPAASVGR
jgi:NAD(P)-dependent dehydrogenase (short-subunit alcohol dehydrogenase family)